MDKTLLTTIQKKQNIKKGMRHLLICYVSVGLVERRTVLSYTLKKVDLLMIYFTINRALAKKSFPFCQNPLKRGLSTM